MNIIIYRLFRVKKFPLLKFYFLFPLNGKDLKTSSNQKKTRCTDTDFMQTGNLFSFFECFSGAEIENKSVFERRATTGSGSTFFSFQYTSTLTNFQTLETPRNEAGWGGNQKFKVRVALTKCPLPSPTVDGRRCL